MLRLENRSLYVHLTIGSKINGQKMAKDFTKFSKYRQKWASDLRPQKLLDTIGVEFQIRRNRRLGKLLKEIKLSKVTSNR